MDTKKLNAWLRQPRDELIKAVADSIAGHVASLRKKNIDFYGYAILPGEPYQLGNLTAVANTLDAIKAGVRDKMYTYYRYSVDEWKIWSKTGFAKPNKLIDKSYTEFRSLHSKDPNDFWMDKYEQAHSYSLLQAILSGIEQAKKAKVFGPKQTFLAMWISDSSHKIIFESVRRLNLKRVADAFDKEFGDSPKDD